MSDEEADSWVVKNAPWIVRGTIVGLGVVGFAAFARSIRLFTTFRHARQIPDEFIRKQMKLKGRVESVGASGLIHVRHVPIFRVGRSKRGTVQSKTFPDYPPEAASFKDCLVIQLAGVQMSEGGPQWLKQNLMCTPAKQQPIRFQVIRKTNETLDCEVLTRLHWFSIFKSSLNQELVRRGLARIPSSDDKEHLWAIKTSLPYARLINKLVLSEKIADQRGVGLWRRSDSDWVEAMSSLPSQSKDIVKNSQIYRIGSGVLENGRIAAETGWELAKNSWKTGKKYSIVLYKYGNEIFDELAAIYNRSRK